MHIGACHILCQTGTKSQHCIWTLSVERDAAVVHQLCYITFMRPLHIRSCTGGLFLLIVIHTIYISQADQFSCLQNQYFLLLILAAVWETGDLLIFFIFISLLELACQMMYPVCRYTLSGCSDLWHYFIISWAMFLHQPSVLTIEIFNLQNNVGLMLMGL